MRNFACPYFSQSPGEFWRRWHISLSTWFKDYVYFPLGGARVSTTRNVFNIMVTFLLSGLWHGASWNFIIWGAMSGLGVVPEIIRPGHTRRTAAQMPAAEVNATTLLRIGATFSIVCLGWVFFRANTLGDAMLILKRIIGFVAYPQPLGGLLSKAHNRTDGRVFIAVAFLVFMEWRSRGHQHPLQFQHWSAAMRWSAYTVLFWVVLYLGSYGSSQFIYFQF